MPTSDTYCMLSYRSGIISLPLGLPGSLGLDQSRVTVHKRGKVKIKPYHVYTIEIIIH